MKLGDIQKDYSKVTACLMQLLAGLLDVFRSKPSVNDMESKTETIQIILYSLKLAGHGNQSMNKVRKKCLLSGVSGEHKDLLKIPLKLVSAISYQIFIFSPIDHPSKTMNFPDSEGQKLEENRSGIIYVALIGLHNRFILHHQTWLDNT